MTASAPVTVAEKSGTMAPTKRPAPSDYSGRKSMREIGHFVGGKEVKGGSGRFGDVFNPNTGEVQAKVAFAKHSEVEHAIAVAEARAAGLGGDEPAAARPRADEIPRTGAEGVRQPGAASLLRARQDLRRRQGRHAARPRSGRVRLRHSAPAQGRIHRRRRSRHRPLFHAPAARRRRRHHAVQFPGDDPDVEIRAGARLRQCLHPQAVGARSVGADAARRAVDRGRAAGGRAQRRQRRQGSGRHAPHRPAHQGRRLRRLFGHRRIRLHDGVRQQQTRAMFRRRQEPHDRDAGRRHGSGRRCADRRRLRLGRRALHGDLGRRAGRQEDRRHPVGKARAAGREPEDRPLDRHAGRLRADDHAGASGKGQKLRRSRRQGRRQARGRRPRLQAAGLRAAAISWAAACSTT